MKRAFVIIMLFLLTFCAFGCHRAEPEPLNGFESGFESGVKAPPANDALAANPIPAADPQPNAKSAERLYFTIGYSALTDDEAFFQAVKKGLEDACGAAGIELLSAAGGGNVDKMRACWKDFCEQGADIIIDFNLNREAGSVLTKEIDEKYHVPVISVDERYSYAYFFGVDNEQAGVMLGEFAAQKIQEKWNGDVDFLLQLYNENNGKLVLKRNECVLDGLKNGGVTIPEENIEWISAVKPGELISTSYLQPLIAKYMVKHLGKDDHILVACYNDDAAVEMNRAVKHANASENYIIVSHNADPNAVAAMKEDDPRWLGSMNYQAGAYGAQLVVLAKKLLSGAELPKVNYADIFVIDKDNVYDYFPD